MKFQDLLDQLGRRAKRDAEEIANRYLAGGYESLDEAAEALALVVRSHNIQGSVLGEASCREILTGLGDSTFHKITPGTLDHWEDHARLSAAAITALSVEDSAVMASGRLALGEVIAVSQKAYAGILEQSSAVEGFKRGLEKDACQLCRWWWREGRVWPKWYTMPTHVGCTCTQVPVMVEQGSIGRLDDRTVTASDKRRQRKENMA